MNRELTKWVRTSLQWWFFVQLKEPFLWHPQFPLERQRCDNDLSSSSAPTSTQPCCPCVATFDFLKTAFFLFEKKWTNSACVCFVLFCFVLSPLPFTSCLCVVVLEALAISILWECEVSTYRQWLPAQQISLLPVRQDNRLHSWIIWKSCWSVLMARTYRGNRCDICTTGCSSRWA